MNENDFTEVQKMNEVRILNGKISDAKKQVNQLYLEMGKKLYEHVAIAYEQLQIGEEEIRQNGELENGLVSIGASENALRLVLLSRLEKFHEQYPHVRLRISNHSTPQAIQALRSEIEHMNLYLQNLTDVRNNCTRFLEFLIIKIKKPHSEMWGFMY